MRFNGEKLRIIRSQQRKTASEVAASCGVSAAAVSKWEKPREEGGTNPTLENLACAAQFLGVTPYDLCDEVPEEWNPGQIWHGPPPARPEDQEDHGIYMSLARRLRIVREALGLTPDQFAARYGIEPSRWGSIEDGSVRPNVGILKRIVLDYELTLDFLVFGILRSNPVGIMVKVRQDNPGLLNEDPTGGERDGPSPDENPEQGERSDPLPFRLPSLARACTFLGASLTNSLFPLLAYG